MSCNSLEMYFTKYTKIKISTIINYNLLHFFLQTFVTHERFPRYSLNVCSYACRVIVSTIKLGKLISSQSTWKYNDNFNSLWKSRNLFTTIKVVVFSVGGCYSNQFLVLPASCCIQSGSILYLLEATPTQGYNYWA